MNLKTQTETKSNIPFVSLAISGIFRAFFASLWGSFAFITVVLIPVVISSYTENVPTSVFDFVGLIIGFGSLWIASATVTLFPAGLGAILLCLIIWGGLKKENITERGSLFWGIIISSIVMLVFCILITAINFAIGPGHGFKYSMSTFNWTRFAFYTIVAVGISVVAGGLTAKEIFRDTKQKMFER